MFDADKLMLTGLVEITLPTQTIRLCDGGFVYWGADKYSSSDPDFGTIQAMDEMEERLGDEAPGGSMTFLPESTAAAATLSQATFQGSPIRFWLAEVSEATGLVVGTPELVADMELDATVLRVGRGARALDMEMISVAERLFSINEGNVCSTRFHQTVFTGELGFDNATGVPRNVPWGVESPPRGVGGGGGSSGAGGGFSGGFINSGTIRNY